MNKAIVRIFFLILCGTLLLAFAQKAKGGVKTASKNLYYRLVYLRTDLSTDLNVERAKKIMMRAKLAGYNGIVLSDFKLGLLDLNIVSEDYYRNAKAINEVAKKLGLDIYPTVCGIGYSGSILYHDPNLAEGMPVREALFIARQGVARLVEDPPVALKNGDFEKARDNKLFGWDYQDNPGKSTFVDLEMKHSGKSSLRMENFRINSISHGNARVMQKIKVSPFRQYHLSVWIKTKDFDNPDMFGHIVLANDNRNVSKIDWNIERTQDWKEYHAVFNSLNNGELRAYFGVWGGKKGTVWFDNAKFEEVGLMNILRRPSCPLTIKGENGTIYEEGRDFLEVKDKRLSAFEIYHESPVIELTAYSRIKEWERLRVNYAHAAIVGDYQATVSLTEPKVYTIIKDQINSVNNLLHPKGFFMSHDEILVGNWLDPDLKKTPGQLLADNVRRCIEIIRAVRPDAKLFVWSDMFDPNHNAVEKYYLVNGPWTGSWNGLTKDVIISNWNFGKKSRETAEWFALLGNSQILAGYYDGSPRMIYKWLGDLEGIPNINGVMYTTWQDNYNHLEEFANAAWGN